MRNKDKNLAENYIKKHETYKKWLAFVLCLSLITGGVTLYMLNKPATAMTAEGAESVGLVIDTADAEFEQELINETLENSEGDTGDEDAEAETSEDSEMADAEETLDNPETAADSADEAPKETETADTDRVNEAAGTGSSLANAAENAGKETSEKEVDIAALKEKLVAGEKLSDDEIALIKDAELSAEESELLASLIEEKELLAKEKESKLLSFKELGLDVPVKVNVADYVTETIIERKKSDGSWEVIAKEDVKEGDYVRITYKYDLPEEAKLSEDISMEIPEELNFVDIEKTAVLDGNGNVEVTGSNIKIEYNEETKQEIIDDAMESNLQASSSALQGVFAYVNGGVLGSFFRLFAPLRVSAAGSEGVTYEGTATKSGGTAGTDGGAFLVDAVTLQKWDEEKDKWVDIATSTSDDGKQTSTVSIKNGDKLNFSFKYTVEQNALDSSTVEGRTITYELPAGIKPVVTENGTVRDSSGRAVGTYTLNENGLLTAVFTETFAKNNKDGAISGTFNFEGSADFSTDDDKETITYDFSNDVVIVIPKEKEETTTENDLNINKTGLLDTNSNTASYTITVSSVNGTGKEFTLRDSLKFYEYDDNGNSYGSTRLYESIDLDSIKVTVIKKNADGETTDLSDTLNCKFEKKSNSTDEYNYARIKKVLPELKAGESYTITYSVALPDAVTGTHSKISNYATGQIDESTTASPYVNFYYNPYPRIEKSGAYNGNTNSIDWEIKIHTNKANLKGYKVTDLLGGEASGINYTNDAVLYLRDDSWRDIKQKDIKMPYTFDFDTDTSKDLVYKIKFSTSVKEYQEKFAGTVSNYADIKKDGNGNSSSVGVPIPAAGGVNKSHTNVTVKDGTIDIVWNVTILGKIDVDSTSKKWTYYDELQSGYVSESELSKLQQSLSSYGVAVRGTEADSSGNGYKKFEIDFIKALAKGETITFSYSSHATVDDPKQTYTYTNTGYAVNNKQYDSDTVTYKPTVEKYDFVSKSTGTTQRDYFSDEMKNSGVLSWGFMVNIPENADSGNYTIVEEMPVDIIDSSKYDGLPALMVGGDKDLAWSSQAFDLSSGSGSVNYNGATISASVSGKTVTISVPADELKNQTLYFCIRGQIPDNYEWGEIVEGSLNYADFTNKVTVSNGGGVIGTSEHTQSVSHNTHSLEKWSDDPEGGIISYSVDVNKFAVDLLPGEGNDTLILEDVLTGTYKATPESIVDISIVPGTLKVVKINNATGEETELEAGTDYHLSTHSQTVDKSTYTYGDGTREYENEEKIILEVPDSTHLLVTYEYFVRGTIGVSVEVSNSATLKGVTGSTATDKISKPILIEKSKMTADVNGINLFKVDELDNSIYLEGAQFSLYEYNPHSTAEDKYDLVGTEGAFVSDETGFVLLKDPVTNGLKLNTAYKLVEFKAPTGYDKEEDPYYFIIVDTETAASASTSSGSGENSTATSASATYVKPDNFKGATLFLGSNIYISNLPQNSDLKIVKTWNNPDGTANDATGQQYIEVELRRKIGSARINGNVYDVSCSVRQKSDNWQFGSSNESDVTYGSVYRLTMTLSRNYFNDFNNAPMYNKCSAEEGAKIIRDQEVAIANAGYFYVEVNGSQKFADDINYDPNSGDITVTYDITIAGNTDILAYKWYNATYTYERIKTGSDSDAASKSAGNDEHVEDIRIYADKNWTWKSSESDSDKYPKFFYDESTGLQYYYYYYVVEKTTNSYYEVTYMNNSGISSGTIGIVNTRNKVEGYTLPRTGGKGDRPLMAAGAGIIGLALFGGVATYGFKRRRKRAG